MILKANDTEVSIKFKIRDIVKLTEEHKKDNLQELFFESIQKSNLKNLALMILAFGYKENEKAFKTETQVYDFLDNYFEESGKTQSEIYLELGEEINNSGFFTKKMSKEEIKMMMIDSLDLDINKIVEDMVKEVANDTMKPVLEEQFKGFKA